MQTNCEVVNCEVCVRSWGLESLGPFTIAGKAGQHAASSVSHRPWCRSGDASAFASLNKGMGTARLSMEIYSTRIRKDERHGTLAKASCDLGHSGTARTYPTKYKGEKKERKKDKQIAWIKK